MLFVYNVLILLIGNGFFLKVLSLTELLECEIVTKVTVTWVA
jgi:hypothetical protein